MTWWRLRAPLRPCTRPQAGRAPQNLRGTRGREGRGAHGPVFTAAFCLVDGDYPRL